MIRTTAHYYLEVGVLYHESRYEVINLLGVGSTSTVWAVNDLRESRIVAIKVLDHDYRNAPEEQILRTLADYDPDHPGYIYVMKLRDSFRIVEASETHVCLVVDVVGPSLSQRLEPNLVLSPSDARPYFYQLLLALQYAHAAGVIHADIKLDNILMSVVTGDICLCDWGEAASTETISARAAVQPQDLRAPEVIVSAKPWTSAIDIWNFGALILEVVEKKQMFKARDSSGYYDPQQHLQQIVNFFGPLPQSLLEQGRQEIVSHVNQADLSREALPLQNSSPEGYALITFLTDVMVIDPAQRPTATQLIDNSWFASDPDQI